MRARRAMAWAAVALVPLALGGCGGLAGGLRAAGVGGTPDEFMVLPTRPLEMPDDMTTLPPPTPGQLSRVDRRPRSDAIAGLTGRPVPAAASGAALVAQAGPRDPAIRSELAAEDVAWRENHHGKLLERMFSRDREELRYRPMVLDPGAELERLRAAGVQVPAAPPAVMSE